MSKSLRVVRFVWRDVWRLCVLPSCSVWHEILISTFLALLASAVPSRSQGIPPSLKNVGFDQKLDAQLPLDVSFRDETGKPARLRQYFGKKPVVLSFAYYSCPMLCTLILDGEARA